MHIEWEKLHPGDRERLLAQMIRTERDLRWRMEREARESEIRGAPSHDAAVHKRLSLLLRNLRGGIAAARDYIANASALNDPSTAAARSAPGGNR